MQKHLTFDNLLAKAPAGIEPTGLQIKLVAYVGAIACNRNVSEGFSTANYAVSFSFTYLDVGSLYVCLLYLKTIELRSEI